MNKDQNQSYNLHTLDIGATLEIVTLEQLLQKKVFESEKYPISDKKKEISHIEVQSSILEYNNFLFCNTR